MLGAFLTAYPWDLMDEGLGPVLDRLCGEIGVTGLSVWVAARPLTQLRVHHVEPRVFRTRGGLFFQPSEEPYAATRCKPVASSWLRGRDPLARIVEACQERQIELRAILSAAAAGRIAHRQPDMACKNVFGIESQRSVCLVNPDVQTYLSGLVADLCTHYDLAGVSMIDFGVAWYEAFEESLHVAWPLGDAERFLWGLCFCESCRQNALAAEVDVASVTRLVRTMIETGVQRGAEAEENLGALWTDREPLASYVRWQTDELSALLRRVKGACRGELLLYEGTRSCNTIEPRVSARPENRFSNGLDLSIPDAVIARPADPDQLSSALIPGARRNELGLPASVAVGRHGTELVALLGHAAELGFAAVEIDNYGLLPDGALTRIKQAIRFARRSTGD